MNEEMSEVEEEKRQSSKKIEQKWKDINQQQTRASYKNRFIF